MRSTAPSKATGGVRAILLAAGLGSRLRPLTDAVPKCLIPIAGRPLVDYWFDRLAEVGAYEVLINTHHHAARVREHIDHINAKGRFRVAESYERVLLGSAGTVHANRSFIKEGEDCLIVYADNLSNVDLAEMMCVHRSHGDPITMMLFHAPRPEHCGIAELNGDGRIVGFVEKPSHPRTDLANGGVYALSFDAYRQIADMNRCDLAFDVLPAFVGRMRGWVWEGYHRDIGTPESLRQARIDAPRVFGRPVEKAT